MLRRLRPVRSTIAACGALVAAAALAGDASANTSSPNCGTLTPRSAPEPVKRFLVLVSGIGCSAAEAFLRDYYVGGHRRVIGPATYVTFANGFTCIGPKRPTQTGQVECRNSGSAIATAIIET